MFCIRLYSMVCAINAELQSLKYCSFCMCIRNANDKLLEKKANSLNIKKSMFKYVGRQNLKKISHVTS